MKINNKLQEFIKKQVTSFLALSIVLPVSVMMILASSLLSLLAYLNCQLYGLVQKFSIDLKHSIVLSNKFPLWIESLQDIFDTSNNLVNGFFSEHEVDNLSSGGSISFSTLMFSVLTLKIQQGVQSTLEILGNTCTVFSRRVSELHYSRGIDKISEPLNQNSEVSNRINPVNTKFINSTAHSAQNGNLTTNHKLSHQNNN